MTSIALISFSRSSAEKIGKILADKLDMFFATAKDVIEYSLISSKDAMLTCGVDYLEKEEQKVLSALAEYENSVIVLSYDEFVNNEAYKNFLKSYKIVYIKNSAKTLEKEIKSMPMSAGRSSVIDLIDFTDRNSKLEKIANIIIDSSNKTANDVANNIVNKLIF